MIICELPVGHPTPASRTALLGDRICRRTGGGGTTPDKSRVIARGRVKWPVRAAQSRPPRVWLAGGGGGAKTAPPTPRAKCLAGWQASPHRPDRAQPHRPATPANSNSPFCQLQADVHCAAANLCASALHDAPGVGRCLCVAPSALPGGSWRISCIGQPALKLSESRRLTSTQSTRAGGRQVNDKLLSARTGCLGLVWMAMLPVPRPRERRLE